MNNAWKNHSINQVRNYQSISNLQTRDAVELMEKYKSRIKWDVDMKIIDIGCGPGNVTYDHLLPIIPKDAELLGIDISESMIQVAKLRYNRNPRLNFETFDILDPKVVEKYAAHFDTAFSFYCFHWIQDQRNLMKTVYSILKPGGELIFMLVYDCLCYPLWETLEASSKWHQYYKNCKKIISPYYSSVDPVSDIVNIMQNEDFNVKECSLVPNSFTFSSKQVLFDWMNGLNSFSKNVPTHLAEEYEQEWKKIVLDQNLFTHHEATGEITITNLALTGFVQKPY